MLVFVVDSVDRERLLTARQELHALLAQEPRLPLVVLANKQVGAPLQLPGGCFQPNCLSCGTPWGNLNTPNPPALAKPSLAGPSPTACPKVRLPFLVWAPPHAPANEFPESASVQNPHGVPDCPGRQPNACLRPLPINPHPSDRPARAKRSWPATSKGLLAATRGAPSPRAWGHAAPPQPPLVPPQDKSDALSTEELREELALQALGGQRELFLLPTSATWASLSTATSVLHLRSLLVSLLSQS